MEPIIDFILGVISSFSLGLVLELGLTTCLAVVAAWQTAGRAMVQWAELSRILAGAVKRVLNLTNLGRLLLACTFTRLLGVLLTKLLAIAPPSVKRIAVRLKATLVTIVRRAMRVVRRNKDRPFVVRTARQRFNKAALKEKFSRIRRQSLGNPNPSLDLGPEGSPA